MLSGNKVNKVELKIASLGAGGDGVAFYRGNKVFVPFALEGETILAEINKDKAKLLQVIEASPLRVKPPCPYFAKCGGCAMQHLSNQGYLSFKQELLQKTLSLAKIENVVVDKIIQTLVSSRRRVEFVFNKMTKDNLLFGFNQKRSHNIVNIDECLLLRAEINQIIRPLKKLCLSFAVKQKGDIKITLADNGLDIIFKLEQEPVLEELENMAQFARENKLLSLGYILAKTKNYIPVAVFAKSSINFSGYDVMLTNDCFLQPSKEGEDFLASLVMEESKNAISACDIFSGLGVFSFALVKAGVKTIKAFDSDALMIAALNNSAKVNNLNISAQVRDLFRNPLTTRDLENIDLVVLDPPRAGAEAVVSALADLEVKIFKIIMISCNPASFARDAKTLINSSYKLTKTIGLDQFSYSPHLEVVGIFSF